MKILLKFLIISTFSFIIVVGSVYGVIYKFRDKELPFQKKIVEMFQKEAAIDTTLITEVPTVEQLRARDYEDRRLAIEQKEIMLIKDEQRLNYEKDSLDAVKQQLNMLIGQREGLEKERLQKLAKVYEGMRPEEAAPVISQLDDQTIVEIFLQMDDRRVAKILGQMPIDRATEITQRLSGAVY